MTNLLSILKSVGKLEKIIYKTKAAASEIKIFTELIKSGLGRFRPIQILDGVFRGIIFL